MIKFSIVIPAYNRGAIIGKTIESLLNQDSPNDLYEILVCDNNSTDNTKEVIESFIGNSQGVILRYFREKRQGVHYARNATALKASGKYIYFTDDDMIAKTSMLKEFEFWINKFPELAVLGGKVLPKWESEPPPWILRYFSNSTLSLLNKMEDVVLCKTDPGIASCHQLIRKDVFLEAGGFRPEYTKDEWLGDGECGLNREISKLGYSFGYFSNCVTHHLIPKARMSMHYICKRYKNQGQADAFTYYRQFRPTRRRLFKLTIKHTLESQILNIGACLTRLTLQPNWRLKKAAAALSAGFARYTGKLYSNRKLRDMAVKKTYIDEPQNG